MVERGYRGSSTLGHLEKWNRELMDENKSLKEKMGSLADVKSPIGSRTLKECETVIDLGMRAHVEAWMALKEIHDRKLYQPTYESFKAYGEARWGYRQEGYRYLKAAEVTQVLLHANLPPPPTSAHARELWPLVDQPDKLREAWMLAKELNGGNPNFLEVRDIVRGFLPKQDVADVPSRPSASYRYIVFERDEYRCRYCGKMFDERNLQADHVIPVSKGGSDDMANLVTACETCNRRKHGKILKPLPAFQGLPSKSPPGDNSGVGASAVDSVGKLSPSPELPDSELVNDGQGGDIETPSPSALLPPSDMQTTPDVLAPESVSGRDFEDSAQAWSPTTPYFSLPNNSEWTLETVRQYESNINSYIRTVARLAPSNPDRKVWLESVYSFVKQALGYDV